MARKSPLNKLQESVVGTVKGAITHPVASAEKAVEQAKGTISLGRMVAGQVTKTAAGAVTGRLAAHRGGTPVRPVRPTDEPLRAVASEPAPESPSAREATPQPTPVAPGASGASPRKTTVEKAAKKAAAKKSTPKKAPTPTRVPVSDVATKAVKKQAANQPVKKAAPAPTTSIDAAADPSHVDATPADVAKKAAPRKPAAKKAPVKKAATSSPGAKLPVKKAQPDPEPLLDPSTAKAVASESDTLARAADPDKG